MQAPQETAMSDHSPSPSSPSAPSALLAQLSALMTDTAADAARSVVSLRAGRARLCGFAWRDGFIVTADEALPEDTEITITLPGGASVVATVAGRDPTTDVALLRIEAPSLPALRFTSDPVAAGALVLAVGSQDGATLAASGVVALAGPAWRSLRGGEIDARIELDIALRASAQGSPALDAQGRVIGMAVFGPRRRVLAIPSATIERVAAQLASHGRVPRGYLGVSLQPVTVDEGRVGAMVMGVAPSGPAATAGLHQGDVILAWNAQPIRSVQALLRSLVPASVGSTIVLSLRRAGQTVEVQLVVGERPAD
jgi:S1-C subfamily serine protease